MADQPLHVQTMPAIEQLVRSFETCQLPRSEWTHQAHVIVALWFLVYYPAAAAIERMRTGIRRYNQAVGVENSQTSGYHETLTLFWIYQIQAILREHSSTPFTVDLCQRVIQQCNDPALPLQYYSHDYLMSWQARSTWVEPDLRPLS